MVVGEEFAKLKKIRRLAANENTLLDAVSLLIAEYRRWPKESRDRDFVAVLMLEKFRILIRERDELRLKKLRGWR